jgi:hypothetical protein
MYENVYDVMTKAGVAVEHHKELMFGKEGIIVEDELLMFVRKSGYKVLMLITFFSVLKLHQTRSIRTMISLMERSLSYQLVTSRNPKL